MKFKGFLQGNNVWLKLLLTVVLTVFLATPAMAAVDPRGSNATDPQGRVLADTNGSCINSTLSIDPNTVPKADTDLRFNLSVKNVCTTELVTWVIRVAYGDDRVLSAVETVQTFGNRGWKSGETKTFSFPWNMSGVTGLTNPTTFYPFVAYTKQVSDNTNEVYRGTKISIPFTYLTPGTVASKECFLVEMLVNPKGDVTQADSNLYFDIAVTNKCGVPRNAGVAVLYNKDQVLNAEVDRQNFDVNERQVFKVSWNLSGVQGLTETTNFYAVVRYSDPTDLTDKTVINQKSNVVQVKMKFAGVGAGDGGVGNGNDVPGLKGGADKDGRCLASLSSAPICAINLLISGLTQAFRGIVSTLILSYLGPFIETLVSIRTYTDGFADVIYGAWQILRNLGNIFFILAIVAIGVATVFRISGYAVKDVLVKLITGAILINFSLTIAQAILGVADTAQNQFLGPNTGAIRAIINPLVTVDIWAGVNRNLGEFSTAIRDVISFWVTFAAFVALLGVAFLLFARVVILWILLMLSPIPYVAMVLPATRKFSHQWWSTFIKWAFMTPIIAFMLNLTATITELNNKNGIIKNLSTVSTGNSSESVALMFAIAGQAIPIAFLYMTIKAGTAFGKGTSGFVDKVLDKGASKAFLPAAFLGGAAAGAATKLGSGVVTTAKNAAAVPYDLARMKLAQGRHERAERYATGQATFKDRIMSGISAPFTVGKVLDTKRKRLETYRKDYSDKYDSRLGEFEKNKLSWEGGKVVGNKALNLGSKLRSKLPVRLLGKNNVADVSQLKTDEELNKALVDAGDKEVNFHDESELKSLAERLKVAEAELKDGKLEGSAKEEKEKLVTALQSALKNVGLRENDKDLSALSGDPEKLATAINAMRTEAQKRMDKAEFAPSYLTEKFRHENTKSAASRLPSEYSLGEYANFLQKALAKGDKFGALLATQTIEQEGDIKDLLKQLKYSNDSNGLKQFYKDYFGGKEGAGKGFDLGKETMTQVLRESDKRAKASGDWDLGGKIKYDTETRKYVEDSDGARTGKNVDKRIGEGTVNNLWNSITTKVATTVNSSGGLEVSKTALEALRRLNTADPQALKSFAERINTPMAKNLTTFGQNQLIKDEETLKAVKQQLMQNWENEYIAREKRLNPDLIVDDVVRLKAQSHAEDAYMMLQHGSQEVFDNSKEINDKYKQINEDVREIRGYGKARPTDEDEEGE